MYVHRGEGMFKEDVAEEEATYPPVPVQEGVDVLELVMDHAR